MTTGTEKTEQESKPIVSIWDGDFLPFYVCHTKEGEITKTLDECKQACDEFINNVNNSCKADYYGGYLTIGKRCFRYLLNPEYKANRKYDKMPRYFHEIRSYLYDKHNFAWQEEYEADDLVLSFKAQNSQYETIIVSPDKDVLNTVGKHYNPRRNEFMETYSVHVANKHFWESMITGDTIDGIKGKGLP